MIDTLSLFYLRGNPTLCCFLPSYFRIMTKDQVVNPFTWNEPLAGTGPTFVSFSKSSTQKVGGFLRTRFRNTLNSKVTLTLMSLKSRCYSQAIRMSWSMSSMHANFWFVQIEVKQRILNINRSCIIENNLLLLLVSYKLIFKFSHRRDSKVNNSPISVTKEKKLLLLKNALKWKKQKTKKPKYFFPESILYLAWYNFLLLYFSNL